MTLRFTGPVNADLNEIRNLVHEKGAAVPGPFVAAWQGRSYFVTTPGADYGLWIGGVAAWERPVSVGATQVTVPNLGNFPDLQSAIIAIGAAMPPPTHPDVLVNWAEETNEVSVVPLPLGGMRIAQGGRVIGGVTALEGAVPQDLFLAGNGRENCVRNAIITGTNAATRKVLSLTCMSVRDDNFLVPGDVGSPYFPTGIEIAGQGLFDFRLHCAEIKRPIDMTGLDPALGFLSLDWGLTTFCVPVTGLALKAGETQKINKCDFWDQLVFASSDAPVVVYADRCNFFVEPVVSVPNIRLEITDSWIGGRYYSWALITDAGIIEGYIGIPLLTTAQKVAMVALAGYIVYDTNLNVAQYYDGANWVNMGGGGGGLPANYFAIPGGTDLSPLVFNSDCTYLLTQAAYNATTGLLLNNPRVHFVGLSPTSTLMFMGGGAGLEIQGEACSFDGLQVVNLDPTVTAVIVGALGNYARFNDVYIGGASLRAMDVYGYETHIQNCQFNNQADFGGGGRGCLYVGAGAGYFRAVNSRFDWVGDCGAGNYTVTVEAPDSEFLKCELWGQGPFFGSGILLVTLGASKFKVEHCNIVGYSDTFGAIISLANDAEITNNVISSAGGGAMTPAISSTGERPHIAGNRILSGGGTIWTIVINGGNYGRILGNYYDMTDMLGNVGIDIAVGVLGYAINNNVVNSLSGLTFAVASPLATVGGSDFCTVVGNVFRGPIGAFGPSSQVFANVVL